MWYWEKTVLRVEMTEVRDDRRENKRECIVRNPFLDPASGLSLRAGRRSEAPLSKISSPPPPKEQLKEGLES